MIGFYSLKCPLAATHGGLDDVLDTDSNVDQTLFPGGAHNVKNITDEAVNMVWTHIIKNKSNKIIL